MKKGVYSFILLVLLAFLASCEGGSSSGKNKEVEQLAEQYLIHLYTHNYEEAKSLSSAENKESIATLEQMYTLQEESKKSHQPSLSEEEVDDIVAQFDALGEELKKELESEDLSALSSKGKEEKAMPQETPQKPTEDPTPETSLKAKAKSCEVNGALATVLVEVTQDNRTHDHQVLLAHQEGQWLVTSDSSL